MSKNLWGGRFSQGNSALFQEYTASIGFDRKLFREDILGSLAHANMLAKTGILPGTDAVKIQQGLLQILELAEKSELEFSVADEDIHMNVERKLTELVGPVAGKLHTARSRNDQVALDVQLYIRSAIAETCQLLLELIKTLKTSAEPHINTPLPGLTHLQHAQPVTLAHHLLAYAQMFSRDLERFTNTFQRANLCPLGAGALAGTGFPIDREYVARLLNFAGATENSMDTVCNRDSVAEFIFNSALCFAHLSRFCEELIIWAAPEFGFVSLADEFCTGSSMMPQKKNPDLCELLRGKTGRVYGNLITLLTVIKGLPLTYFKDLQEDKEPLFDTVETLLPALKLFTEMLTKTTFRTERMARAVDGDFSNVTDAADYLAGKGLPFREAHEIAGKIVRHCVEHKVKFDDLPAADLRAFSDKFGPDFKEYIRPANVIARRRSYGGTSPTAVTVQLTKLEGSILVNQQITQECKSISEINMATLLVSR